MAEPETSGGTVPDAPESSYVGWLVKLEIIDSRARGEDQSSEVDNAVDLRGLDDVLRFIEADFRLLTVPLLGKSERVLPSRALFRVGKIFLRWDRLLREKTGGHSFFRVRVRLEPAASVSSHALLGRFHPDHREPNIFDALEETRRLFEESRRKENEGG